MVLCYSHQSMQLSPLFNHWVFFFSFSFFETKISDCPRPDNRDQADFELIDRSTCLRFPVLRSKVCACSQLPIPWTEMPAFSTPCIQPSHQSASLVSSVGGGLASNGHYILKGMEHYVSFVMASTLHNIFNTKYSSKLFYAFLLGRYLRLYKQNAFDQKGFRFESFTYFCSCSSLCLRIFEFT